MTSFLIKNDTDYFMVVTDSFTTYKITFIKGNYTIT